MNEFLITLIVWTLVYIFEAKSDCMGNVEKKWDSYAFAVFHLFWILYFGFWLGAIAFGLRLVVHNWMINVWRNRWPWSNFTKDNPDDWYDGLMVWFQRRGINHCWVELWFLVVPIIIYYLVG